jgi:putative intracellular protease/amidase
MIVKSEKRTEKVKTKALVIFYPDCIEFEAMLATQMLHGENLTIDVATPDGADYLGPSGIAVRATHSYAEVHPEEYRVVIVPGGDTETVLDNITLIEILRGANDAGATFGAICAGPLLLARAGLLKERRFTHGYGADSKLADWEGGCYMDQWVVVDGNIVTAKPQAYIDFAVDVLYAAGLRDSYFVESGQVAGKPVQGVSDAEIEAVKRRYRAIWGGG